MFGTKNGKTDRIAFQDRRLNLDQSTRKATEQPRLVEAGFGSARNVCRREEFQTAGWQNRIDFSPDINHPQGRHGQW
jgi:hypothetical protein